MLQERRFALLVAPLVGALVGLAISAARLLLFDVIRPMVRLGSPVAIVLVPTAGLAVSGLLLQFAAKGSETHDTEAYIARYHEDSPEAASAPVKLLAGLVTIGAGGGAGMEGPSVHAGSELGRAVQVRLSRFRSLGDRRTLLAAGAAAGVAAVFKTPLTGVLFALEVPFKDDVARTALIPSVLSSVSSYLVAVSIFGTEPLFPVARGYSPDTRVLLLSLVLGVVIGLMARLFVRVLGMARIMSERLSPPLALRAAGGGLACGLLGLASLAVFGTPLVLGAGYELIDATVAGSVMGVDSLWLFLLRSSVVLATLASGAAGGSFFPLLSLGAAAGAVLEPFAPQAGSLMPLVGMAAFLSAGYGTPLTAAVFIAESTGLPGYVIPGLIAAATAYVMAGGKSLSHLQRPGVTARLEAALRRPVSDLMTAPVVSVPAAATVGDFIADFVVPHQRKSFPVCEGGRLIGMVSLDDVRGVPETQWASTTIRGLMERDVISALPHEAVAQVLERMQSMDIDRVPVVDPADSELLVGIVTMTDLQPILARVG